MYAHRCCTQWGFKNQGCLGEEASAGKGPHLAMPKALLIPTWLWRHLLADREYGMCRAVRAAGTRNSFSLKPRKNSPDGRGEGGLGLQMTYCLWSMIRG